MCLTWMHSDMVASNSNKGQLNVTVYFLSCGSGRKQSSLCFQGIIKSNYNWYNLSRLVGCGQEGRRLNHSSWKALIVSENMQFSPLKHFSVNCIQAVFASTHFSYIFLFTAILNHSQPKQPASCLWKQCHDCSSAFILKTGQCLQNTAGAKERIYIDKLWGGWWPVYCRWTWNRSINHSGFHRWITEEMILSRLIYVYVCIYTVYVLYILKHIYMVCVCACAWIDQSLFI